MRVRTLMIHGATKAHGLTPMSPESPLLVTRNRRTQRRRQHPPARWRTGWLFIVVIVLLSAFYCGHGVAAAASSVDFSSMTFADWAALFTAASTQLPQLYRMGPRVRAKIFVSKSLSMNELFNSEAILRQQISDIVGVPLERVAIEYLETNAMQETARGAWAVTLGISALQPPPSPANTTLITDSVDFERQRIANCLLYGGIVGQANVTLASLQVFGTFLQLLAVRLDGEAFYQIDTSPWVGVSFVLAADATTSMSLVSSVGGDSISSVDAFQNLRLRLLLTRFLGSLQLETSSILIRHAWLPPQDSQPYNVPAIIVPVEVHIGDDDSLRSAVSGYLRNTSLITKMQELMPHWTLLAVEVDENADALAGNSTGASPTSPRVDLSSVQQFEITLLVTKLPFWHVQNRQHAIRDATRTLLSYVLSGYTVEIDFSGVTLVQSGQTMESVVTSDATASLFYDNDNSNTVFPVSPLDRTFLLRLVLTVSVNGSVQPVALDYLRSSVANAINSQDPRVALGFVDYTDLSLSSFASSTVEFKSTTFSGQESMSFDEETAAARGSTSFVEVSLVFEAHESMQSLTRAAAIDTFALYRVRCALLLVLELVFVSDADILLLSLLPIDSPNPQPAAQVNYRIFLQDEKQREGISRAIRSGRFTQALGESTGSQLELRSRVVHLYTDGSRPQRVKLPGTGRLAPLATSDASAVSLWPFNGTEYVFSDPLVDANPSVLPYAPADCEPRREVFLFGCFVVRWNSSFPARTLLLRRVSVSPGGVGLQSSNLRLPNSTYRASNTSTSNNTNATAVPAPWVPGTTNTDEPTSWSFQFLSDAVRNATLQLWFEFTDSASNVSLPAFQIATDIALTQGDTGGEPSYRVISSRQLPSSLLPVTFMTAPSPVVTRISNSFASVSSIDNQQPWIGLNASLSLTQQSSLGLFNPAITASVWQQQQPNCLPCSTLLETCSQHSECDAIAKCFRRVVDQRLPLFDEMLQAGNRRYDLTDALESCLSSPSFKERVWSTPGRAEFVAGLRCVTQSSCIVANAPRLSRQLSLRYTPRYQRLALLPSHVPFSLSFIVDVDGGYGHSRSLSTDSVDEITPLILQGIRDTIVSLYGVFARSIDVVVHSSQDEAGSNATVITMEYYFWDVGFVGLPFVSVNWNPQEQSAPTLETHATQSLWLNSSNSSV